MVHDGIRRLHQLAHQAMSGQTSLPSSPADSNSIWEMLANSGLTEKLRDGTIRYTELGSPAEIELLLLCGRHLPVGMPFFLEQHGHASKKRRLMRCGKRNG